MIDRKTIENLAQLARIRVTENEADHLVGELSSILGYVDTLTKVDTSHIPHDAVSGVLRNVWRDDVESGESDPTAILDEAPLSGGGYVKVKKVISYE